MKPQLAIIRGLIREAQHNGMIVEIIQSVSCPNTWLAPDGINHLATRDCFAVLSMGRPFDPAHGFPASMTALIGKNYVFPINDNPGNESWFTVAPRSKPATTKHDTIDARGMVRS